MCKCKCKEKVIECPITTMKGGIEPVYMTEKAACADIAVPAKTVIPAHTAVAIPLKIAFNLADDYKVLMYPRSSLLIKRGLMQPVSVIEPDYNGFEVHAPVYNLTDKDVVLEAGERVAQIEVVPRYDCVSWLRNKQERTGGFGSTGAN